jgi:hypothetical protein
MVLTARCRRAAGLRQSSGNGEQEPAPVTAAHICQIKFQHHCTDALHCVTAIFMVELMMIITG